MMRDNELLWQRFLLSMYIQDRNERDGLDTPDKRLQALGERMKEARDQERERVLFEQRERERGVA